MTNTHIDTHTYFATKTHSGTHSAGSPNGYLLHSDSDIVVIATLESENRKTGNMIQIWILCANENPVTAVKTGHDGIVCGDCKHRGNGFKDRTCYVNVGQGPNSVYCAYISGAYPYLPKSRYAEVFYGRKVRFGAYGDPVLIPLEVLRWVAFYSDGWTGYTHQWRNEKYAQYREYVMASVDSVEEYRMAKSEGWRTFRVRSGAESLMPREIACPASDEAGKKTTCERCGLCNGTRRNDGRKDIAILVHGASAGKFIQIGNN
jgi:hypothetical protein